MLPIENEFNYRKTPFSMKLNRRYKNIEKSFRSCLINYLNLSPQKFFSAVFAIAIISFISIYIYYSVYPSTENQEIKTNQEIPKTIEEEKQELKEELKQKMNEEVGNVPQHVSSEKEDGGGEISKENQQNSENKEIDTKKEEIKVEKEEIKDEILLKVMKGEEPKTIKGKKELIKRAFQYGWEGYKRLSMGFDLLCPLTKKGENKYGGFGATIFSCLDTAILMNLEEIVVQCDQFIEKIDFLQNVDLPFCDLTSIYIGSLLSAHTLRPKKGIYLKLAEQLVKKIFFYQFFTFNFFFYYSIF